MTARLLTALVVLLTAGAANAQDAEGGAAAQAMFRGVAPGACQMSSGAAPLLENAAVTAMTPGAADLAINQLVDGDSVPLGATVVLTLPAICNQAHTVSLSSLNGGLRSDGPIVSSGPFRSTLPYTVTVAWAGGARTFQTNNDQISINVPDAAVGSVTVTIVIPAGGDPLAAGAYTDELVLELGAAG